MKFRVAIISKISNIYSKTCTNKNEVDEFILEVDNKDSIKRVLIKNLDNNNIEYIKFM